MTKGLIIQARLGSTRLPHKMVIPFYETKGIFEILVIRIKTNFPNQKIILATSVKEENDLLEKIAEENGILVFRGEENNVLKRFVTCAKENNISEIIRICSDNPFLDIGELKRLIEYDSDFDYVGFNVNNQPNIKTHFGFWAEYVTLEALEKVLDLTSEEIYLEHVTNYIYEHPEIFNINFLSVSGNFQEKSDIRMTVDTKDDFTNLSNIYYDLMKNKKEINIENVVEFLINHPTYKEIMLKEIKNNSK